MISEIRGGRGIPPGHSFFVGASRQKPLADGRGWHGYAVHASVYVGKGIVALTADDIDVLVAYIVPLDVWYVVPVRAFAPRKNLWFYPKGSKKGSKFEEFREA